MENELPSIDRAIRFVRIVWCDNANVIRAKAFHTALLEDDQQQQIGVSIAQQAVPVMFDGVVPNSGLGPVGEAWLVPDWSTYQPLPYAAGQARVMGDLFCNGEPWSLCPRGFLKRMIAQLEAIELEVKAAFEPEFYLLRVDETGVHPVDETLFAASLSMDLNATVINEIADALVAQNIPVERYYPEAGAGQQEISIRYCDALQAADWQIMYRETVRGVALKHGMRASFLPKIFANQAGSGCHLHLSLWEQGENLIPDCQTPHQLSLIAQSFVAGILHHLPALMALTTPSVNSYRRLQPHFWSGAYRCWGYDNREAAVRIPSNPTLPSPTHIELKTIDASANPYLALGATIAAGLDGIQQRMILSEPIAIDPGDLSPHDRQQQGIDRLPANLGEAIDHLRQDSVLLDALGADLARAFLAVRSAEWNALKESTLEAEVKLLLDRY